MTRPNPSCTAPAQAQKRTPNWPFPARLPPTTDDRKPPPVHKQWDRKSINDRINDMEDAPW